jgi:hypothetical protein
MGVTLVLAPLGRPPAGGAEPAGCRPRGTRCMTWGIHEARGALQSLLPAHVLGPRACLGHDRVELSNAPPADSYL